MPRTYRRLALGAAFMALAMLPSGGGPHAVRVALAASDAIGVPATTSSFYVYGSFIDVCGLSATTECPLYDDGAREAVSSAGGMTILDFGAPCYGPATRAWGTQLFNSQGCTPDGTLVMLAGAWLRGFETNPNRSAASSYVLAVGTSNSLTAAVAGNALTSSEMVQHGQAWFTSVVTPIADVARLLPSQVTIWAGNDIEQSSDGNWYDGPTTSAWVDAYASASGASKPCMPTQKALMVDFGDYVPTASGWTPAAVYHVAWQAAPACPVPEIYNAINATEWQSLDTYAVGAGLPQLGFTGVLSQDGADGTLASSDSWASLQSATGQAARYVSVIGTTGPIPPEVPDAPSAVTAVPGPGLIMLRWSAPAWDGGAGPTTYNVVVYAGSIRAQVISFSGFPAPEAGIVTGLDDGTSYRFYVSATNKVGTGPLSLPSEAVVPSEPLLLR
ncbi:MAG TPA: fibronectin type III domain-containing protein [Candidatus Dormibacteraeota bacterium]|nr:fibronectin type III domain-containing protein [Candidatus Dormibacteraeota bacterium]